MIMITVICHEYIAYRIAYRQNVHIIVTLNEWFAEKFIIVIFCGCLPNIKDMHVAFLFSKYYLR